MKYQTKKRPMRKVAALGCGPEGSMLFEAETPVLPPDDNARSLREYRVEHGISMGEAAREAGVTVPTWSALENGEAEPAEGNWAEWKVAVARCIVRKLQAAKRPRRKPLVEPRYDDVFFEAMAAWDVAHEEGDPE